MTDLHKHRLPNARAKEPEGFREGVKRECDDGTVTILF